MNRWNPEDVIAAVFFGGFALSLLAICFALVVDAWRA